MRGTPTIYFKSLNRSFNIFGADKSFFYLSVGICIPIAFSARLVPMMDSMAILIFLILHTIGTLITRADHQMLEIYKRHIHYRGYYTAISGIHSKILHAKPSVPIYQGKTGLI